MMLQMPGTRCDHIYIVNTNLRVCGLDGGLIAQHRLSDDCCLCMSTYGEQPIYNKH